MQNDYFTIEKMAEELNLSRTQLPRKLFFPVDHQCAGINLYVSIRKFLVDQIENF